MIPLRYYHEFITNGVR